MESRKMWIKHKIAMEMRMSTRTLTAKVVVVVIVVVVEEEERRKGILQLHPEMDPDY